MKKDGIYDFFLEVFRVGRQFWVCMIMLGFVLVLSGDYEKYTLLYVFFLSTFVFFLYVLVGRIFNRCRNAVAISQQPRAENKKCVMPLENNDCVVAVENNSVVATSQQPPAEKGSIEV